ncbi:hypothetical protein FHX37_0372 [Haloactinospora alba]|uniref:Uncharacterized protein n=1 Tax=Haloactinospora alba TaxID=405555 RepID=A0A543NF83_9ACTN|nr:hypothetical protein [Haloactinospora alba]TQN30493.1 hypothetical protein FHX37_0372 [Haloactinospora alba]
MKLQLSWVAQSFGNGLVRSMRDTLRGGAVPMRARLVGGELPMLIKAPLSANYEVTCARMELRADNSDPAEAKPAAQTPRLHGAAGECPRNIPA